jgi:cyclopropane fatty-acyl-phospholipid synthase-like methyltransferase
MDFIHLRIAAHLADGPNGLEARSDEHYADLGCGVGAGVARLAELLGAPVTGITLSRVQADIAAARFAEDTEGPPRRVVVGDVGDTETLRTVTEWGRVRGAWMIESLNHIPEIEGLLEGIAEAMRAGGLLLVCDDFIEPELHRRVVAADQRSGDEGTDRLLREFIAGWHVHTPLSVAGLQRAAGRHGFEMVDREDFSAYAGIDRPRDYLVAFGARAARALGLRGGGWDNLRGGHALRRLTRRGLIRYQLLVFRCVS